MHTHVVPQRAVVVRCDGVVGVASLLPRSGVVRVEERGRGVGGRAGWIEELGLELELERVCFCQLADGAGMSVGRGAGGARGWDWMGGGGGGWCLLGL